MIKVNVFYSKNRSFINNILGNYFIKGLAMIVSLVLTPAYISYFSSQKILGLWFTLVAVLEWILLFDFGIGGGMRNEVTGPLLKNDSKKLKEIFTSAFVSVAIIVILLLLISGIFLVSVNIKRFFGMSNVELTESTLKLTVGILLSSVILRLFTTLGLHILYALQYASIPSLLTVISSFLFFITIKLLILLGYSSNIIYIAFAYLICTNIPQFVSIIVIFSGKKLKSAKPNIKYFSLDTSKKLLSSGFKLFYLQILIISVFATKELFISWFAGIEQVVVYQIYYKLIGLVGSLFSLSLAPVWSSVSKAVFDRNFIWIRNLYKIGMIAVFIWSVFQFIIILIMPFIVKIWLGNDSIEIEFYKASIFAVYNIFYMITMLNYNILCGLGITKRMSLWLLISFLINFALSFLGSYIMTDWIVIIFSSILSLFPMSIIVSFDIFKILKIGGVQYE